MGFIKAKLHFNKGHCFHITGGVNLTDVLHFSGNICEHNVDDESG